MKKLCKLLLIGMVSISLLPMTQKILANEPSTEETNTSDKEQKNNAEIQISEKQDTTISTTETTEINSNLTDDSLNNHKATKNNSSTYENYLIPDLQFRKIINYAIGIRGEELETYSATQTQLNAITLLNIQPLSNLNQNYVEIDSLKGIELLHNLKTLQVYRAIIPESALQEISTNTNVNWLTMNTVIFKGDDPTCTTTILNSSINDGEIQEKIEIPLDNHIDLSAIGNLINLKNLSLTLLGAQQTAELSYSHRTHFDVSGLGSLINLTTLNLGQMPSVDDPTFKFIENLQNLSGLTLVETPLSSVEAISKIPSLSYLNINKTSVKDYTPIINKSYFSGASSMKLTHDTQYTTSVDDNGTTRNQIILNTDIMLGSDIDTISFNTINGFQGTFGVSSYDVIDGKLVLDLSLINRKEFSMFNWETGLFDIKNLGFVYGFNIKTKNNKTISYSVIPVNVGKVATFDLNYENAVSHDIKFDIFEKISPLSEDITKREGYTFAGWYLEEECLTVFDFDTEINDNFTLYAKWEKLPDVYGSVHINPVDSNGRALAKPYILTGIIGTKYTLEPLEIEGYTFVRFDISNITRNKSIEGVFTEDTIEIKAIYKKIESPIKSSTSSPSTGVNEYSMSLFFTLISLSIVTISITIYIRKRKISN